MDGILIVGYGAPQNLDEVRSFMTSLMGREPSDELMERTVERYRLIGGGSPLVPMAQSIASKLEDALSDAVVEIGMLHTEPSIEEGMGRLVEMGADRIVAISLSPFYSTASNGKSFAAVGRAAENHPGVEVILAPEIGEFTGFAMSHARAIEEALDAADVLAEDVVLAFTSHSVPMEDYEAGDFVYEEGIRRVVDALAEALCFAPADDTGFPVGDDRAHGALSLPRPWGVVYHSQGARGGAWLGPKLGEFMAEAAERGAGAIVVCPIGFSTDHMETLYDLDVAAAQKARDLGLGFVRSAAPNASTHLIDAFVEAYTVAVGADSGEVPITMADLAELGDGAFGEDE